MSDLIKREDAIEVAYQLRHKPNDEEWDWWLRSFNAIPSAGTQGEWKHDGSVWTYRFNCTNCGYHLLGKQTNFCPNCGARMKGADDD